MPDPSVPSFSVNKETSITLTIPKTEAYIYDQGYAYNQAGFTYNQPGVTYGGLVDQNWDMVPMVLTTNPVTPHASAITDQYIPPSVPDTYHSIGPGWFMFVTIP